MRPTRWCARACGTRAQFFADLTEQINELQSRPARHWQSAEESSLDAWLEKYPLYNEPGFSVSYYNKGQLLGLGTGYRHSRRHGQSGQPR